MEELLLQDVADEVTALKKSDVHTSFLLMGLAVTFAYFAYTSWKNTESTNDRIKSIEDKAK